MLGEDILETEQTEEIFGIEPLYNKHWIRTDDQSCITDGWSDGPCSDRDTTNAICINDKGGYQFRLYPMVGTVMQRTEENPPLYDWNGMIPLYKYEDGEVVRRSEDEIEADRAALPVPEAAPTAQEDTDAMLVDHEYRLTLLELGVNE